MGQVTPQIVEKFRTGGGLSYDDYPGFHDVQAEESARGERRRPARHDHPAHGSRRPAARRHRRRRRRLRRGPRRQPAGPRLPGQPVHRHRLQRRGPVAVGRAEAAAWGLTNASFETPGRRDHRRRRASSTWSPAFDAIHDQAHPATVLANIHRALRPGGTFLMVDIDASSNLEENVDTPVGELPLRDLAHALHVGLARPGRGRARHRVGRADRRADGQRGRLRLGGAARARGRPVQRLLRGHAPERRPRVRP